MVGPCTASRPRSWGKEVDQGRGEASTGEGRQHLDQLQGHVLPCTLHLRLPRSHQGNVLVPVKTVLETERAFFKDSLPACSLHC